MATHTSFKSLQAALERDVNASVQSQLKAIARTAQPSLDRMLAAHSGKPVESVMPHMRAALKQAGLYEDEAQVREWSQTVTDGDHRVLEVSSDKIKWI